MAKDDSKQADEPVDEKVDNKTEDPVVELDKPTEVEGEIIENPVLEEEDDTGDKSAESDSDGGDTDAESQEETDTQHQDDEVGDTEKKAEPAAELEPEKDETGVYEEPAPDPGEFQPKGDYSFEVKTTDGKTVKISTPEQADAFANRLDSEEGLITAAQFLQFNRSVSKMDSGIDKEKGDFEAQKDTFEAQKAQQEVRDNQVKEWNNGLNYLQSKGILPEIPSNIDVPGGWEKNPEDPGVKARMEIFNWMDKENRVRETAGISPIMNVVDAHSLMLAENQTNQANDEKKSDTKNRQAKGKMVSGNAPFTPEQSQPGMIVGEGGSLNDLVREAQ